MGSVVLEPVEVLVTLPTVLAAIWLFLLHAQSTGIRRRCLGIDDGECAVSVVVKSLVSMAMLFFVSVMHRIIEQYTHRFMVFQAILILVSLLASYYWTLEWLLFLLHEMCLHRWRLL